MYPQSNYLLFGMEYAMYVCLLVFAFAVFCFVVVFVFDCNLFVSSAICFIHNNNPFGHKYYVPIFYINALIFEVRKTQ